MEERQQDNCVIIIGVPSDITLKEVNDVLDNCGKVKSIESYELPGMLKKEGQRDLLVEFEDSEGRIVAKQIGGVKYKHWVVKVRSICGYGKYKQQEKDNAHFESQLKEGIDSIVSYFKGIVKEKPKSDTTKEIVIIDSAGQQRVFKKKEKPLPPLPKPKDRPLPPVPSQSELDEKKKDEQPVIEIPKEIIEEKREQDDFIGISADKVGDEEIVL